MTLISRRPPPAARRLLIGLGVGALVGVLTPAAWPPEARVLLGWVAFTLAVMAQLWPLMMTAGPGRTRELATREDDSRAVAGALTTSAALVSLIGVMFLLSDAHDARGAREVLLTLLAVGTVVGSWLLVQTEYALHYARLYYRDGRGILFPHGDGNLEEPTYWDFAYLSVTIGMTYQVSDTNLNTRAMRRLLLGHALLSFVFGTVIIAVTINGVAGLIQ